MANFIASMVGRPNRKIFPKPVIADRAPTSADVNYELGQVWIDKVLFDSYFLAGFSAGAPQWVNAGGGGGVFSSLTVTPGPTALTGALTVTAGASNVSIGSTSGTIIVGAAAQTGAMTFGRSTAANTLNIGTGVNAGAQVVNISTGASAADSTINVFEGIATAGTQTFNMLNGASTSTGQAVNIMTGAGSGTRVFNLATNSAIATTIAIGDGLLGNTISLGNGINSVAQTVSISSGASAADSTVDIMAGATTAGTQTVNIATGTGGGTAKVVNVGNADGNTDIVILSPRESSAGAAHTLNASRGRITATGLTTASAADETITITNSACAATSGIIVGLCVVGAEDARPVLEKVVPGAGSFTVQYVNDGAAALASNLIISFELYN